MSTWTAPVTWAAAAVTAASMNTEIRDHANFLKGALDLITNSTTADTGTATYLQITRPVAADHGLRLFASGDTVDRLGLRPAGIYFSDGTAAADATISRGAAGRVVVAGTNPQLGIEQGTGGVARNMVFAWIAGDSQPRIAIGLNASDQPRIAWGGGAAAAADFFLTRDAAGRVVASATADHGRVGALLNDTASEANSHFAWASGDTIPRVAIGQSANGLPALRFSPGSGAVYEEIYRASTGNLSMTGALQSIRAAAASSYFFGSVTGDTGPRIRLTSTATGRGQILFHDGTAAAGSEDTNLYSSAANVLKTDDTFNSVLGYQFNGTAVVGARATGWAAATNTKLRTTFDTTTVTTANLAARVGALIDDLITHGLIGA